MASSTPVVNIQGNPVGNNQIDPPTFFKYTRRQRGLMTGTIQSFAGLGETDSIQLKPTGILAAIDVHVTGTVTTTLGTGTAATTWAWPYGLVKLLRLTANGQTNLIKLNGLLMRARQIIATPGLNDRGVSQTISGATVDQGTLALAEESWGLGQASTISASGTVDFDLTFRVPISWDLLTLYGALYLQTTATSVEVNIDWETLGNLFTLTGDATVAVSAGAVLEGIVFTIPIVQGYGVIPDLSVFHSVVQNDLQVASNGSQQLVLPGQGVDNQLMRMFGQLWSNNAPLPLNAANFGQFSWGYGLQENPEVWHDGQTMADDVEESYGSALGLYQGIWSMDFAKHWSARDSVDEGAATQLNVGITPNNVPTNGKLRLVQEVMINAAS